MRTIGESGFSLLELVATLTILGILVAGTVPLAQNAVQREKELRLMETLRTVRNAIDEWKRDSLGACPPGAITSGNPAAAMTQFGGGGIATDPRSRVVIDDCKIFETENADRYPPTLESLVDGVRVKPRGVNQRGGQGLGDDTRQATELNEQKELLKAYLREMPVDPITGKSDWKIRSSYQDKDSENWDEINVFDIRSSAEGESLSGEKYSDW